MPEMRQVLNEQLDLLMAKDERIVVVDADLAKSVNTLSLHEKYPDRCFDIGVAEQNMLSISAGLASYGYIPFALTFTPFATRRALDQLAISINYARLKVVVVGLDPGIAAEMNGGTHMSFEDVGIVRSLPRLTIVEPVDTTALTSLLPQIIAADGPTYLRLFRKACPDVYDDVSDIELGRASIVRPGSDISLLAAGRMVPMALEAAAILADEGIDAEVRDVHTLKPLDTETILDSLRRCGHAVTCENSNVLTGLYAAIAGLCAEQLPMRLGRVGVEDRFGQVGFFDELAEDYGLTAANIVQAAREELNG